MREPSPPRAQRIEEPDAGPVSAEEAREIAQRFIDRHFGNDAELPRISIPADPRRDDDIRIVAFIEQAAGVIEAHTRLRRELEALREQIARGCDVFARVTLATCARDCHGRIDAILRGETEGSAG